MTLKSAFEEEVGTYGAGASLAALPLPVPRVFLLPRQEEGGAVQSISSTSVIWTTSSPVMWVQHKDFFIS